MISQVEIRSITPRETLLLRRELLRPDHPLSESVYAGDDDLNAQHWGAFVEGALVAIASLYREALPERMSPELTKQAEDAWRLRGMAVGAAFQGKGYGTQLLKRCLQSVADHGGNLLWCNARSSALGFYEGMGFQAVSSEFEIPGVGPHFVMLRFVA